MGEYQPKLIIDCRQTDDGVLVMPKSTGGPFGDTIAVVLPGFALATFERSFNVYALSTITRDQMHAYAAASRLAEHDGAWDTLLDGRGNEIRTGADGFPERTDGGSLVLQWDPPLPETVKYRREMGMAYKTAELYLWRNRPRRDFGR